MESVSQKEAEFKDLKQFSAHPYCKQNADTKHVAKGPSDREMQMTANHLLTGHVRAKTAILYQRGRR